MRKMSEEQLVCGQCGDELEGSSSFFLRWLSPQGEYEYCCLEHDCLAAVVEANKMTDLNISCAGCGGDILKGPEYLLLPTGFYVHDHETCLTDYLVKCRKAERSKKFYG